METLTRPILEWHSASVTLPSEEESGDRGSVRIEGSRAFVFAIDALGHGQKAAIVAEKARAALLKATRLPRLEDIFGACHGELKDTRGAAICLARIDATSNSLSWLSVGNIQAVLLQRDRHGIPSYQSLIMRGGVVGDRLPELQTTYTTLSSGDMLLFATDGIGYDWHPEFSLNISPRTLCNRIMERHRHGNDDALIVALRYNGLDGFES